MYWHAHWIEDTVKQFFKWMLTVSVAMTVAFLTISEEFTILQENDFWSFNFWCLCLKNCLKEIKKKHIHQVTNSDKKIGIKIVLCSHPETQIILSVNLVEGIRYVPFISPDSSLPHSLVSRVWGLHTLCAQGKMRIDNLQHGPRKQGF